MIRRMFRVAKYAAIGATVAVVGTTVLGALGTSMAWFAAPTLGMGIGTGIIWGLVKVSSEVCGERGEPLKRAVCSSRVSADSCFPVVAVGQYRLEGWKAEDIGLLRLK